MQTIPILGPALTRLARAARRTSRAFPGSEAYWERRYQSGGDSGAGSYSRLAEFKAEILNELVRERSFRTVIEFGSGDGHQLTLASYPSYIGFDVSENAISRCRSRFAGDGAKAFRLVKDYAGERADLTLSLDVVYHLVEDAVFHDYMARLFDAADRCVVVYASNTDQNPDPRPAHVRHRKFTSWVEANRPAWRLARHIPNRYPDTGDPRTGSFADFFIFEKT
ncbi:MAG TPA: hypothetical protein DEB06_07935 [Phycisphaerales bacterium]|nr:hypothetical protein [Phycisphaerales bacterium]